MSQEVDDFPHHAAYQWLTFLAFSFGVLLGVNFHEIF
jgi:hypothetical protein